MKKYLLLILTLFLVACGEEQDTSDFTNSLKKQGYLYYYSGISNVSGNRHSFVICDTTQNKIFLTEYNTVTGGATPFQEVVFK